MTIMLTPLWRGSVQRWECDENDHLNVRFHFAIVDEALAHLFAGRWQRRHRGFCASMPAS